MGPEATACVFPPRGCVYRRAPRPGPRAHAPSQRHGHPRPDGSHPLRPRGGGLRENAAGACVFSEENGCAAVAIPATPPITLPTAFRRSSPSRLSTWCAKRPRASPPTAVRRSVSSRRTGRSKPASTSGNFRLGPYAGASLRAPPAGSHGAHLRRHQKRHARLSARFEDIHGELLDAGCDCAILACTELSCFAEEQRLPLLLCGCDDVLVEQSILACAGNSSAARFTDPARRAFLFYRGRP
jgi:hypothetical protein